ncbi:MAG: COR domain-containing protein, partial [Bacteroidota bacterium]
DDSPVLMFLNKKGDIRENVAMQELSSFYPNLKKELATINLKTDAVGILKYQQTVAYHIRNLPHFQKGEKVPTKWVNIRKRLNERALEENYISIQEFRKICVKEGIEDAKKQLFVSDFLHSLGAILHFSQEKLLRNMVILKPEWATGAVYKVLDHTAKKKGAAGRFLKEELEQVWSDLSYQDVFDQLLALMEKFELCYELPGNKEEFIVPKLMPNDHPGYTWKDENQLHVQYHYTFMPKGIVTRLIVRLHELIEDQSSVWKRGAKFQLRNTEAEVKEIYRDKQIHIKVKGNDRKELLGMIMKEIDAINGTFDFGERLKVEKLIPCNCPECINSSTPHFYKYSVIQRARDKSRKTIECQKSFLDVPIASLLEDVFDQKKFDRKELENTLLDKGIEKVFETLDATDLDRRARRNLTMLQGRYNNLERMNREGVISDKERLLEQNRIRSALLNFLDDLEFLSNVQDLG